MTSKERVISTINHIQPDRIAVDLRFTPVLLQMILEHFHFSEEELWELIGQDVFPVRPSYKKPASIFYYADPTMAVSEEGYLLDIYRVPFKKVDIGSQTYIEMVNEPPLSRIETVNDLEKFPWPQTVDWDYAQIPGKIASLNEKAVWPRSRGCFVTAQMMRGMDTFLIDLALNEKYANCILDKISAFVMDDAEKTLIAGGGKYTFIEYNDDFATQRGMLISPEMWRYYMKDRMKKFVDLAHRYHAKVKCHSCGSVYDIIPDFIDIGVDILNPIQPLAKNMDPFKIKKEFGKYICLHGGIDIQELLPKAPAHEVYQHVRRLIDEVGKDGGYILSGSHVLQPDTRMENILAISQAIQDS
jgi:uroporphyrinogen decarboxylase